ncbi:MAG: CoA transferase [Bacteroidia bacterium]|nr:CoA transferase [Bacteroidia bacterium]
MFKNLKVVELANVLAGPSVGMFFAELGADVIKIENRLTNGDITRAWKLPGESPKAPLSAYYASVNWGKRSILLDLSSTKDKKKAIELLRAADIVIANYKNGDAKKLGMDYTSIKKINPKIIYAHISGFGSKDKRVAFDLVLQAETGFLSMNGTSTSGPVKLPVALIDILAGHQLKEAVLIALLNRSKTGKGAYVETSLYGSAIASLANQGTNWLLAKHIPKPMGTLHPNIAPYGEIVTCKDNKQIVLAIGTDKQFSALCIALNAGYIFKDKRFSTNSMRVKNRSALLKILQKKFSGHNAKPILTILKAKQVPMAEIKNIKDVFLSPVAKKMILKRANKNIGLKTVAFKIAVNK